MKIQMLAKSRGRGSTRVLQELTVMMKLRIEYVAVVVEGRA